MKSVLCWMGVLACCGNLLCAEDTPAPKVPLAEKSEVSLEKQIQVQVEFIEMSHEQLTELLFMREAKLDATPLRKEVQELVKQGKAKVLETLICTAANARVGKAQSVSEYAFPTEYQYHKNDKKGEGPTIIPASFEMQYLGNTLEVSSTLDKDEKWVQLSLSSEVRWLTGEVIWFSRKNENGEEFQAKMPQFYVLKLDGRMNLKNGQYVFYATLTPKDAGGNADAARKVMVFVKTDVVEAK